MATLKYTLNTREVLFVLGLDCYLTLLASLFLSEMEAGDLVSPPLEDLLCSPFTLVSVEGTFSSVELLLVGCFRGQGSFMGDISLAGSWRVLGSQVYHISFLKCARWS